MADLGEMEEGKRVENKIGVNPTFAFSPFSYYRLTKLAVECIFQLHFISCGHMSAPGPVVSRNMLPCLSGRRGWYGIMGEEGRRGRREGGGGVH